MSEPGPRPLDGVRVIDLSTGPAGGIATMVMADFGAEVIKVEQPSGDPFRSMASAPMWLRGKKSVALDLSQYEDQARLKTLTATADAVVSSFRPGADRRFGADYETIREGNPGLVYTHITAFGPKGPHANLPPYEGVVAAKGGRMMAFEGTAPRPGPVFSALQVTHHARHLLVAQLLRHGGGLARVARVVFGRNFKLDLLATDRDALGIDVFNSHARAVFVVLAVVGLGAGNRCHVTDLDHLFLCRGQSGDSRDSSNYGQFQLQLHRNLQ